MPPKQKKPLLDQQVKDQATLKVLMKEDPEVEEILGSASHVTLYGFDMENKAWSRKNVEGTLFVVKRRTVPRFQFVVLNRLSTENCRVDLLGAFEFELSPPYLLYRSAEEVNGIWFYRQEECDEMSALFNKITSAFAKQPTDPQEMSTEMLLQSMGIGANAASHPAAAEQTPAARRQQRHPQQPEQQQFESDSVAALFKAASLGQVGTQMPSTSYGDPERTVPTSAPLVQQVPAAPEREPKQHPLKPPSSPQQSSQAGGGGGGGGGGGEGVSRDSVRAAMYKLVSNDNFIDLMVKELKKAM